MDFNVPTFLKWAGGKRQLLPEIASRLPAQKFNRYFEPFLGGGAAYFFTAKNLNTPGVISDTNEELIITFKVIKSQPQELIRLLKIHRSKHSENYYYKIRALDPKVMSLLEVAARFIYLNKTCFNGLYRVNSKGQFNVPSGKHKNPNIFNENELLLASKLLQKAIIKSTDFEETLKEATSGDLIYLDPPYHPLSATSNFTAYTKDSFLEEDQVRLAKLCSELSQRGCFVILSNSDTPFIRSLYSKFNIQTIKASRAINCIGSKRGKVNELLITNYEQKIKQENLLDMTLDSVQ